MAKAQGVSHNVVARIWRAHGLQPHRIRTFKLSKDKRFVEKLTDVVGVYLDPPDRAVVLCVDEKSQIQALDRTQPGLPLKKGRCGTMTHDYKRNGTTCLFAALNVLEGTVIGSCYPRHRNVEFLKFLRKINSETPKGLDLHLILDNYGTHTHPNVKKWLEKRPRFHLHFIPTSSSWVNLIERWFAELTEKRVRRGVFKNVPDLIAVIEDFMRAYNENPKPFIWTKKVDQILEKVNRCKAIMEYTTLVIDGRLNESYSCLAHRFGLNDTLLRCPARRCLRPQPKQGARIFSRGSAGALRRPPGTRFLCKKPVPGPLR